MEDFLAGFLDVLFPLGLMVSLVGDMKHPTIHPQMMHLVRTSEDPCQSEVSLKDDVFNYNCALLADGLFFLNFLDAVSEGDGFRLITQYKYMMLYCRADGHHSNKYALEFEHVCIVQLDKSTQEKCTTWQQGTMSNISTLLAEK